MPSCSSEKLTSDFLLNCTDKPVSGIEVDVLIINREDVDYTGSVVDSTVNSLITFLTLKESAVALTGVMMEGIKQLNSGLSEVVVSEDSYNKFRHGFNGRVTDMTAEARDQINALANSDSGFVVVIEKKWKGTDSEDAFVVLGWKNGLFLSAGTENTNENDGAFVFTLSSDDISLEPDNPKVLLQDSAASAGDGTYSTTKAFFDSKAEGPVAV